LLVYIPLLIRRSSKVRTTEFRSPSFDMEKLQDLITKQVSSLKNSKFLTESNAEFKRPRFLEYLLNVPVWIVVIALFIATTFGPDSTSAAESNSTISENIALLFSVALIVIFILQVQRALNRGIPFLALSKVKTPLIRYMISLALAIVFFVVSSAAGTQVRFNFDSSAKARHQVAVAKYNSQLQEVAKIVADQAAATMAAQASASASASDTAQKLIEKKAATAASTAASVIASQKKNQAASDEQARIIKESARYAGLTAPGIANLKQVVRNINEYILGASQGISAVTVSDCGTLSRNYDSWLRGLTSVEPQWDSVLSNALDNFYYGLKDCDRANSGGDYATLMSAINNFGLAESGFQQLISISH
jgi:hypothetical protein